MCSSNILLLHTFICTSWFLAVVLVNGATFTVVNNCTQTIWPAVSGSPSLNSTGFELPAGSNRVLQAPKGWIGRFWGRTGCTFNGSRGSCRTGDCGSGQIECDGTDITAITLAEFSVDSFNSMDFYDISLVNGFNLPMMIEARGGSGQRCQSTGCTEDVNRLCPAEVRTENGDACQHACKVFRSSECGPTYYSRLFKNACPMAYSYPTDDAGTTFTCSAGDYVITFCPAPFSLQNAKCREPFQCGSISDIGYPFWGGNRPEICGFPGFGLLNCQGDVPLLNIDSRSYRVLGINYTSQTLIVARQDLWNNTCPSVLYNTTLDPKLFSFPQNYSYENVTLYYDCKANQPQAITYSALNASWTYIGALRPGVRNHTNQFTCNVDRTETINFFSAGKASVLGSNVTCNNSLSVPINQYAAQALSNNSASVNDLQDALANGFSIQWLNSVASCQGCFRSGGVCVHDPDSALMKCNINVSALVEAPVILVLSQIQGGICQADPLHGTCNQPFRCANRGDIKYPFYGNDRPVSCGYPGFELDCQKDVPLITIESISYRVLDIDNDTHSLRVAREDLQNSSCPEPLRNTTLNSHLFSFSSTSNDQNITLNYGCNRIGSLPPQIPVYSNFSCRLDGWNMVWTRERADFFRSYISCSGNIFVPVNQAAASNLATVPLEDALASGFWIQWSVNDSNCKDCEGSGGVCGSNQDSASFACYCTNGTYPLSCNYNTGNGLVSPHALTDMKELLIGLFLSVVGSVTLFIFIVNIIRRLHSQREAGSEIYQNVEAILLNQGSLAPKRYSYSEIKKMTNSFSDKLGQGGYGSVYKGMLPKPDRRLVAVKLLTNTMSNGEEFINEVASISRNSHVNIVNLLGFCYEKKRRALVFEFMPNKSLEKFIYDNKSLSQLGWERMYKIAIGVARGLEYLECNTRIIHFDIKPQNILLDEDFCPKISDFGLARLCRKHNILSMPGTRDNISSTHGTRGTIGYIAPEVFSRNFGGVTHKSDVYSYGMMVLEMMGARDTVGVGSIQSSESYFPDKIYEHMTLHLARNWDDIEIADDEEITMKMLLVAFWCIQTAPSDRPSISKVVEMLEGSLESIQIPPKPVLSIPEPKRQVIITSSTQSQKVETENSTES